MSIDNAAMQQAKMREFLGLLPLTLEIAGLPKSETGKYFNEGLLEIRANEIKKAYKVARQLVIELTRPAAEAPPEA